MRHAMSRRAPRLHDISRRARRQAAGACALAACLVIALAVPGAANAQAGPRELTLHVGPAYTALPNLRATSRGAGLFGSAHYGVSRWWSVGASAGWAQHFALPRGNEDDPSGGIASFSAGPTFSLDVLRVVPFVSLHPSVQLHDEVLRPEARASFSLRAALGFDVRFRRNWTAGLEADWHAVFPDAAPFPGLSVFWLRVGYVFETDALR